MIQRSFESFRAKGISYFIQCVFGVSVLFDQYLCFIYYIQMLA